MGSSPSVKRLIGYCRLYRYATTVSSSLSCLITSALYLSTWRRFMAVTVVTAIKRRHVLRYSVDSNKHSALLGWQDSKVAEGHCIYSLFLVNGPNQTQDFYLRKLRGFVSCPLFHCTSKIHFSSGAAHLLIFYNALLNARMSNSYIVILRIFAECMDVPLLYRSFS